MAIGWIKLSRGITENWLYPSRRKFTEYEAWLHLLIHANFDDSKIRDHGKLITIKRGQILTSELKLSFDFLWDRSQVRRFLKVLQEDEMILKKSTTKFTIITICNYESYQDKKTTGEQQVNNKRTTNEQQTTISKEGKEVKEVKEGEEYSLEHCSFVAMNDETWVNNSKATEKDLQVFSNYLKGTGVNTKHIADFKKHFFNWKRKDPKELQAEVNHIPNFDKYKK